MAGLKKPSKKKDGGKPGTVLIFFLVFFIIATIGAGVTAYYGYEGQNKLREDAKKARSDLTARKDLDNYRMGVIRLLATAVGQDVHADDRERAKAEADEILNEQGGRWAVEPDQKMFAKLFKELADKDSLGFDQAQKKFQDDFRKRIEGLSTQLKAAQGQLATTQKALKDAQTALNTEQTKNEAFKKSALDIIGKNNTAAMAAATAKYKEILDLEALTKKITTEKLDLETQLKGAQETIAIEKARFNKLLEQKKDTNLEVVQTKKDAGDQHALFLDISRGIPFWDRPHGKITRVNSEKREVYVSLGTGHGARTGLTFNVFADDGKGAAHKMLKGTVEIVRVIDSNSSLARITSLYDSAGLEIPLTGGRAIRESDVAFREGDLLFNMFWNTHVAIAGGINFTGIPIDAPSEQMRQLASFAQTLERMDIHVDAVLDLTEGQVKGAITNKTRFLVFGEPAQAKDPKDEAQKERAKLINDAINAMKREAIEKGMFLISAENFTIAAGYRLPRNASSTTVGAFRSEVPRAGGSTTGLVIQRARPVAPAAPPMPKEEKKDDN